MASIGFYIHANLSDVYPYNLIAIGCLTEAAIYMRFMRMIVCPSQIYVLIVKYLPYSFFKKIDNELYFKSFETVIVLFAA